MKRLTRQEYTEWLYSFEPDDDIPEPYKTLVAHIFALQDRIDNLSHPDDVPVDRNNYNVQCGCAYDHPDDICGVHR